MERIKAKNEHDRGCGDRYSFLIVQLLSLSRILLALVFSLVLVTTEYSRSSLMVCLVLLGLIELTDLFDGILARRFSVVSEIGAMLDPYADSISRIVVYWGMALVSLVSPLVPLSMAFRDITVAYCRIIISRHEGTVSSNWSGKVKAGFQGIGAFIMILGPVYWPWIGTWTVTAGSGILIAVTLWSLISYARAAVPLLMKNFPGGTER